MKHYTDAYLGAFCAIITTRYAAGLPWKLTEACSLGIPVLCTPLIASQLGQQANYVISCDDPKCFSEAISKLRLNSCTWRYYSEAGLSLVRRFHSKEVFSKNMEALYRRAHSLTRRDC